MIRPLRFQAARSSTTIEHDLTLYTVDASRGSVPDAEK